MVLDGFPIPTICQNPIPVCRQTHGSFETLDNDIQFGIVFEEADDSKEGGTFSGEAGDAGGEEIVVDRQKCDSHVAAVTGTVPLSRPGRLTMVWDNR